MPETRLTRDDVAALAGLARIELTEEELDHLAPELGVILAAVAKVGEAGADDVAPTSHALPLENVFREDEIIEPLPVSSALAGAPAREGDWFRVPRILGEE